MAGVRYLHTDTETRSAVDLTSCGLSRYVDDDSFMLLLIAYTLDDEPVRVIDLTGDFNKLELERFVEMLYDPSIVKQAWNSQFERRVFNKRFGMYPPAEQWLDPMVLAASCGLPLSLGQVSEALNLPSDKAKDKRGRDLIRLFCNPKKDGTFTSPADKPDEWTEFIEYNRQDVVAERTIFEMLQQWIPDESEHRLWCLDARINERGVRIDRALAANAASISVRFKGELTERALELTGLDNPNSVAQVKKWLGEQEGIEVPSLNKKVVADVVGQLQTGEAKEFMDIRSMMSKTSVAKYDAMLRCTTDDDPHARYCFQFFGGHTGRWAGRLLQLQNLSKNYMEDLAEARELVRDGDYDTVKALYENVPGTLSELIRTALIPEPGHRFVVADFSAIEARVTAWLAGEQWRLDAFRAGKDIYCESASQMFKVPVEKHGINGHLRQRGKVAELALGYGGGVNALLAFGADKLGMTDEEMGETVGMWRESSPKIVSLWKKLERAAIACTTRHTTQESGVPGVRLEWERGIMWMTLPSGRRMAYFNPEYREFTRKNGSGKCLTYMVLNQTTRKWQRTETWGGKLTENCLAEGTLVLTDAGWKPIQLVGLQDLVWDGQNWVSHKGLSVNGSKLCVSLNGVWVTPDHKILTKEGWRSAETCNGLDGVQVRLPENHRPVGRTRQPREAKVAGRVCLRLRSTSRHSRPTETGETRETRLMRLPEKAIHLRGACDARHDRASGLRCVEVHETALYSAIASGLEKLWRAWDHGVRALVRQLRGVLGGHGPVLQAGPGSGPCRQRSRIQPGKLSLDRSKNKLPKQAKAETAVDRGASKGRRQTDRDRLYHTDLPTGSRGTGRIYVGAARYEKQVYDLVDCGPNHRFTVMSDSGPMIVHNCVQAVARDCLKEAMLNLDRLGWDIRAHVHDEIICTEPIDSGRTWQDMAEAMCPPIPWAEGLPLRADGYECEFYRKD